MTCLEYSIGPNFSTFLFLSLVRTVYRRQILRPGGIDCAAAFAAAALAVVAVAVARCTAVD